MKHPGRFLQRRRASADRDLGLRLGRSARTSTTENPAGLPLERALSAGAHRHLLQGLLLPSARAPSAGGPGTPDGPGPDPAGAGRPADQHPARNEWIEDVRPAWRGVARRVYRTLGLNWNPAPFIYTRKAQEAASPIRTTVREHRSAVPQSRSGINDINGLYKKA